jgi:HD-GYP domain-containing protein (c-di-GMP phosphodiesterase class II)
MGADPQYPGPEPTARFPLSQPVAGRGPDDRRSLFYPVPMAGLRMDLVTGFDLYLRTLDGGKFILYRRSDFVFSATHRAKLEESGVRDLYIAGQDRDAYLAYLENNLEEIVADSQLPTDQKSAIVYDCSAALVREALRRPWAGENHTRTKRVVGVTVSHILRDPNHIASMIGLLATDYRLYSHSVNVCVLGLGLAERAGLSADELRDLGAGLLLHDVGLAEISPNILAKHAHREPLTADEQAAYQLHPHRGVDLLRRTPQFSPSTLAVVQQHHERCDGQGYPAGLRSPRIHMYAKIAAVADAFDSLTTCCPPDHVTTSFEALTTMQGEMRREFHADLLRSLIVMLGRGTSSATASEAGGSSGSPEGLQDGSPAGSESASEAPPSDTEPGVAA